MGNTQSAGSHNRLSKPKTNSNSNSPYLAQTDEDKAPSSPQYANLSARDRHVLRTQLTSPMEPDFGAEGSSDGDDKLGEIATQVQRRLSVLSRSNSLSCFGSAKTSSSQLASLQGSTLSLVANNRPVDLDAAIKILQEVKKNASPDDLEALHQALQPQIDDDRIDHEITTVNRPTSMIRRRSLITTPGLATRYSPVEGRRRTWNSWKTPQSEAQQRKWKVDMMGTSPLTRLAALDPVDDGRESPVPRAMTPGEMDYSHLGSLKLGSLVVTNGATSPSPSTHTISRQRSSPGLPKEEDYFTASEGCGSPSPTMMLHGKHRHHSRSKSAVIRSNLAVRQDLRAPAMTRPGSPLKTETRHSELPNDFDHEPSKRCVEILDSNADSLAASYRDAIPDSPFHSFTGIATREDDTGLAVSSNSSELYQEEALRILDGTIFGGSANASELPADPVRRLKVSTQDGRSDKESPIQRPAPEKADSGYSSGGSFHTTHRQSIEHYPVSRKPSIGGNDTHSLSTSEHILSIPKPPPTEEVAKSLSVSLKALETTFNRPVISFGDMSPQTPASVTSGASIDSRASLQKRLQKRRPSQPNLPVVQSCQPTEEGTIPDIPANVRSRFTRRLSAAPAMGCLTQTYLSKDHTTSEESVVIDTMTTSSEAPSNLRSTLVADDVIFDHDDEPPTPPLHGRKYGLSLFRTKSTAEKKHKSGHDSSDAVPTVVDLGTIATTLGGSPYDIAMSTIPRKIVVSPTHPHQLGKALPRAKSMVSMDAQTAAELARMRSKDRASLRPAMPKRPKSYQEMNMEAGEGLVLKGRSRNISSEVPPMPAAKLDRLSPSQTSPHHSEENLVAAERKRGSNVRARSSARGPAVSQLIDRYDMNTERTLSPVQPNWDSHALLWGQRCRSIGEGLRQRALDSSVPSTTPSYRAKSQPPEDMIVVDRYSGGLDYGYERGYGIGGSAGTRQLHSSASRKSMHYSNQYGVDLSDVPVFLQRA